MLKLQKELPETIKRLELLKARKNVYGYARKLYQSHDWHNFEVRLANDLRYAVGLDFTFAIMERNPDWKDDHITSLFKIAMYKVFPDIMEQAKINGD